MSIDCSEGNDFTNANEINLIATITLPNLSENLLQIEVIEDFSFPIALRNIRRGYFSEEFGDIDFSTIESFVINENNTGFDFIVDHNGTRSNVFVINTAEFCLSENINGDITFITKFEVRDAVCNINGQQAISATWFPFIDEAGSDNLEIDYFVPRGEDGFSDDFLFDFTPGSDFAIEDRNDTDFLKIFIPYSDNDLAFDTNGDEFSRQDVFLFLGEVIFEDAPDCITVEVDLTAFFRGVAICLPITACCCLVFVALANRYYEERVARSRGLPRNGFNLFFPGNPDIILRPDTGGDVNTVQAVLEEDDPNELDAAVPINTIQVRLNDGDANSESEEEDESTAR